MKSRFVLVVVIGTLVATSSGCGGAIRNFLFGRGAGCGLCNRLAAPPQIAGPAAVPVAPTCNSPTYVQPHYGVAADSCGCGSAVQSYAGSCGTCGTDTAYGPTVDQTTSAYAVDPYSNQVIGSSVLPGTVIDSGVSNGWYPSERGPSYSAGYPVYPDSGYKVDSRGDRIISEQPLPPGAQPVN